MKTKTILAAALACVMAFTTTTTRAVDPLPSWNEGAAKASVVAFVEKITKEGLPDFVPPAERIATFDNDGTLWCEKPMPVQLFFAIDRVKAMAPQHPEWKEKEPFASLLKDDLKGAMADGERALLEILLTTHSGMATEEFDKIVKDWVTTAKHPKTGKHYTEMVYRYGNDKECRSSPKSHFGGTRNPMVVHWPQGIKAKGEIRNQFHHVIDVVPTILEACKIPEPTIVNGIPQKPIEGVSMLYSFDDAQARGRRTTQYFELATNRAIYHDGWVACSRFGLPWETLGRNNEFLNARWELYNVDNDFSEADDLTAKMPEKLAELKARFLEEAKKYDVFPFDPRFSERMDPRLRMAGEPKTSWTYFGNNVWLPEPIGPQLFPRAHTISAELEIPRGGAEGVVTCAGAFSGGWSLYIKDGKPVFRYSFFEVADVTISGTESIPAGKVMLRTKFTPDGSPEGGGSLKLFVNGKPAGEGKLTRSAFRHGLEPFEVGRDSITPIDPAYRNRGQFEFTGGIERVRFELQ